MDQATYRKISRQFPKTWMWVNFQNIQKISWFGMFDRNYFCTVSSGISLETLRLLKSDLCKIWDCMLWSDIHLMFLAQITCTETTSCKNQWCMCFLQANSWFQKMSQRLPSTVLAQCKYPNVLTLITKQKTYTWKESIHHNGLTKLLCGAHMCKMIENHGLRVNSTKHQIIVT